MAQSLIAGRVEGPIHFMPADGRRFPFCGSWRSNWNHTPDRDHVTCVACRDRLAVAATEPAADAEP